MITEEMLNGIQSRAKFLSNEFYFLDEEDLCQEGVVLLLTLEKRNLPELKMFKAVNNLFSKIMRDASRRKRYEVNSSSFPPGTLNEMNADDSESVEERLIKEQLTSKLLEATSGRERYIIDRLVDKKSIDEIAVELGTTRNNIRRLINKIINKRKEIEICD